jgi:hypothetical protein
VTRNRGRGSAPGHALYAALAALRSHVGFHFLCTRSVSGLSNLERVRCSGPSWTSARGRLISGRAWNGGQAVRQHSIAGVRGVAHGPARAGNTVHAPQLVDRCDDAAELEAALV